MRRGACWTWCICIGSAILASAGLAHAEEAQTYRFEDAAQEITQLFWLADTAEVCGWSSQEEAARFKQFSVRFITAHITDLSRVALLALITENGYEHQVRSAAEQSAERSCASAHWESGWLAYKAAADEHEADF